MVSWLAHTGLLYKVRGKCRSLGRSTSSLSRYNFFVDIIQGVVH
jgi:hypothetical protein